MSVNLAACVLFPKW